MSLNTVTITEANFEQEVLKSAQPVLVDFWAPWCGPCKMIAPSLEELAGETKGRFKIAKVNVDENPALASRYQISSIPALLVFKDGQVRDQAVGMTGKKVLAAKLEAVEQAVAS